MGRLTLEVEGGQNISRVCEKAQGLADQTGYEILFVFNGITCIAQPGGSANDLAARQQEEQGRVPVVYSGKGAENGAA